MKIADQSGTWLILNAEYPCVDPESGTRFEPGEPTKAKLTAWAKSQAPTLSKCDDPTGAPAPAPTSVEAPEPAKK